MIAKSRDDVNAELAEHGCAKVGTVHLEVHEATGPAWAVFAGSDGEDPHLVAVFLGGGDARDRAAALLAAQIPDGAMMVDAVYDGTLVPAYVGPQGVVVANHMVDAEGVAVLSELYCLPPERWL